MDTPQSSTSHSAHNPYEFITNSTNSPKKSLFSGGSKQGKIFLILGVLTLIVIALAFVASLAGGSVSKDDYAKLLQQQAEIIRISDLGLTGAKNKDAKNFVITTKETIQSQQVELTPLATAAGIKVNTKLLAQGINATSDKQLTDAQQLNKYDEVIVTILSDSLRQYQQTLEKIYAGTKAETTQTTLSDAYNAVDILTAKTAQSNSGTTESTPAAN